MHTYMEYVYMNFYLLFFFQARCDEHVIRNNNTSNLNESVNQSLKVLKKITYLF